MQAEAWKKAHGTISQLLYHEDPEGMGASIEAPLDEYDSEATALMRALRDRDPDCDLATAARSVYPELSDSFISELERTWREACG